MHSNGGPVRVVNARRSPVFGIASTVSGLLNLSELLSTRMFAFAADRSVRLGILRLTSISIAINRSCLDTAVATSLGRGPGTDPTADTPRFARP